MRERGPVCIRRLVNLLHKLPDELLELWKARRLTVLQRFREVDVVRLGWILRNRNGASFLLAGATEEFPEPGDRIFSVLA